MAGSELTKGRAALGRTLAALLVAAVVVGPATPGRLAAVAAGQGDEDEEDVYESELYGYTLSYDPAEWEVYEEDSEPDDEYDQILFINDSGLSVIGLVGDPDYEEDELADCVADYVAGIENRQDVTDIDPLDDRDAEGEEDDRAWTTTAFTLEAEDSDEADLEFVQYTECRWLGDGVTLVILHTAAADDYEDEAEARDEFLVGLEPAAEPTDDDDRRAGDNEDEGDQEDQADEETTPEAVFRGGPAHTGVQPGPGPEGELTVRWALELPSPTEGYTAPVSPSLSEGVLYVLRRDGLHAVDAATGEELWLHEADAGLTAAPAVADGAVYFTAFDGIYAVDAADGDLLWRVEEEGGAEASPAVGGGFVYVVIGDGETGEEIWRFQSGTDRCSPTVVDGVVYLGGFEEDDGSVLWAIDAESGEELWRLKTAEVPGPPPAVADGTVFAGSNDGVLYAVDAETGDELWQFAGEPSDPGGPDPAPAVADGVVYFGSWDGTVAALDAATGDEVWEQELGGVALYPVVADDAVYVLPPASLFILDASTGEPRVEFEGFGEVVSGGGVVLAEELMRTSPLVADGVVYVALEGGLVAIEGSS